VLRGLAAGLIGGLVASWTMNQFQVLNSKLAEEFEKQAGPEKKEAPQRKEGDDATVKAASAISENVFDHKLTKREKKVAGPAVHCAFGTITGGFYGAAAELAPVISSGAGLPFGAVFWLAADERWCPLGLSKPPTEYPLSTHVSALASHFV